MDESWVVDDKPGKYKLTTLRDGYLWNEARGLPIHRALAIDYVNYRTLESWEHVHHIDGVKTNNDPRNLIVIHKHVHLAIHATIMVLPYLRHNELPGRSLRNPDTLVSLLQEAGVPFIWLGGNK